ncbi:hypothetical protein [Nocardia brasiliensis]
MRYLVTGTAAVAVVLATASLTPTAHAATGRVTFWSERDQQGSSWSYSPPGYRDADSRVQHHAYSFESDLDVVVYAIHYRKSDNVCTYRKIYPSDYDNNWSSWATKLDGVSATPMDCEPA